MKISLAMIVKNEEKVIDRCLRSVCDLVNEIIIVDTGSIDSTIDICKKYTNNIFNYEWKDDFSDARNFSLSKCTGDWILVLDADEYLYDTTKEELIEFALNNRTNIGKVEMISIFKDEEEDSFSKEYISRFFEKGIFFKGKIHEQLDSEKNRIKTDIKVKHSGYYEIDKFERNIEFLKRDFNKNPKNSYILYQLARTFFVSKRYKEADEYFKLAYKNIIYKNSYYKKFIVSYIYNCINIENYFEGLDIIEKNKIHLENSSDFNFVCGVFYMNLILSNVEEYGEYIYLIEDAYLKSIEIGDENSDVLGVGSFSATYNLGAFYESLGDLNKALYYYNLSSEMGYEKSKKRIDKLNI